MDSQSKSNSHSFAFGTRRTFLKSLAVGAVATGTLGAPSIARAQTREITIGGAAPDAVWMNEWFIPLVQKKHDIKIFFEGAIATINLEKLRSSKDEPTFSAIFMDESTMTLALGDGLLGKITAQDMPNVGSLADGAFRNEGAWVQFLRHWTGIAVNTASPHLEAVSWKDLWDQKYKGRVAIPSLKNTDGVHVFQIAAALQNGKTPEEAIYDTDSAFEKLRELKPNLLTIYTNGPQSMNLLEQGETELFVSFSSLILGRKAGGAPVDLLPPSEGVFTVPQTLALVKNGPSPELASVVINELLSEEVQTFLSKRGGSLSVNRAVAAPPVLSGTTNVFATDWDYMATARPALLDRYEREMQL